MHRGTELLPRPRELQVLTLGADGLSDQEIGQRLGIACTTVKCHWRNIRLRYGAPNRVKAIVQSIAWGDIALPERE